MPNNILFSGEATQVTFSQTRTEEGKMMTIAKQNTRKVELMSRSC